jgi:hypothetical protein
VRLRPGTFVHRTPEPDLWWTPGVADVRPATAAELPPGAPAGTRCTLPVVDTGRYLPWLAAACASAGVRTVAGRVAALDQVPADVVVVATGPASGPLPGDDSCVPVQGQVVRLADPGIPGWVLDEGPRPPLKDPLAPRHSQARARPRTEARRELASGEEDGVLLPARGPSGLGAVSWTGRQPASAPSAIAAYRAAPAGSTSSSKTTRLEWLPAAVAGSAPGGQAPRNAIAPGTRCST